MLVVARVADEPRFFRLTEFACGVIADGALEVGGHPDPARLPTALPTADADVQALLADADVSILASTRRARGRVIIEALAKSRGIDSIKTACAAAMNEQLGGRFEEDGTFQGDAVVQHEAVPWASDMPCPAGAMLSVSDVVVELDGLVQKCSNGDCVDMDTLSTRVAHLLDMDEMVKAVFLSCGWRWSHVFGMYKWTVSTKTRRKRSWQTSQKACAASTRSTIWSARRILLHNPSYRDPWAPLGGIRS